MSMPRICAGCRKPVKGRCATCDRAPARGQASSGGSTKKMYTRQERLRRADTIRVWVATNGYLCPGYGNQKAHETKDLTADHVFPVAMGGSQDGDLRVLCRSCNSTRKSSASDIRYRGVDVVLVAGPPGAGKSTYVRKNADPDDMVLDFDLMQEAMSLKGRYQHTPSHLPIVAEARDAVLERLMLGEHSVRRCWIVHTAPERKTRSLYRNRYGARSVVILPSEETCRLRTMGSRPDEWQGYVREWFSRYEPDENDVVVKESV